MRTPEQIEALLKTLLQDQETIQNELELIEANGMRWDMETWQSKQKLHRANQAKIKTLQWVLSDSQSE